MTNTDVRISRCTFEFAGDDGKTSQRPVIRIGSLAKQMDIGTKDMKNPEQLTRSTHRSVEFTGTALDQRNCFIDVGLKISRAVRQALDKIKDHHPVLRPVHAGRDLKLGGCAAELGFTAANHVMNSNVVPITGNVGPGPVLRHETLVAQAARQRLQRDWAGPERECRNFGFDFQKGSACSLSRPTVYLGLQARIRSPALSYSAPREICAGSRVPATSSA